MIPFYAQRQLVFLRKASQLRGLYSFLLLLSGTSAWAQSPSVIDSVQQLPNVRVEGVKLSRFAVGSRVLTLDSAALAPYRTGSLTDVLSARTPLYLKNYGPGQLSTITMRGTSAQHTAVLWNGFNIMLPTLGQTDFSLLPVSGNTQIDVQPGPAASLYGSGAVGGTLLLSSPVRWGAGLRATAQIDGGSFGLRAGSLEGSFSNQKLALRTSLSYRQADNNFHYSSPELGGTVRRRQEYARLWQASVAQDFTLRVGQRGELTAALWLTDTDRQLQPAIGAASSNAQERDQSRRLTAGYRLVGVRHEWAVRAAWFEDVLNYRDDSNGLSESEVHTTQAQAEHTWNVASTFSVRLGAEAQHFAARVDGYGPLALTENRYAGYGLLRFDPTSRLHLSLNLRQALLPGRRPPLTPTLGAEWQLLETATQTVQLKGNASRSYRAPTLNERYWRPGGNPNLLPESGFGYEAGLVHTVRKTPAHLMLQTELTAYRQLVDDWVQWLPGTTGVWAPSNLRKVRAQGLEASTQLTWKPGAYQLTSRLAYAYTQSEKVQGTLNDTDPVGRQLPYVPLHTAAFTTDHQWHDWQATTSCTFTGYRYTDASGLNFLPSYFLVNASVGRTLVLTPTWKLVGLVQGFNLTNLDYQSYLNRAMPPRSMALSVRLAWR
ncbi:TonB-dependent receptor [Hymenobacter sp. BT186]|uniref:TonB-dependent receptor n=1 Tax=Hymenobacter telluris TaxID=2816474 RepID=A0A939J9J2_9BACT|nr:TonB-dependent receptor [Hymenobacter telluris]MBO0357116.1 TonB-dependent receptor [Hymenobacter telluris]MBW3373143.1 TonB-dependent receptor [Hymenobacter norwichensis]